MEYLNIYNKGKYIYTFTLCNIFIESKVEPKSNFMFVCTNLANMAHSDLCVKAKKQRKTKKMVRWQVVLHGIGTPREKAKCMLIVFSCRFVDT